MPSNNRRFFVFIFLVLLLPIYAASAFGEVVPDAPPHGGAASPAVLADAYCAAALGRDADAVAELLHPQLLNIMILLIVRLAEEEITDPRAVVLNDISGELEYVHAAACTPDAMEEFDCDEESTELYAGINITAESCGRFSVRLDAQVPERSRTVSFNMIKENDMWYLSEF